MSNVGYVPENSALIKDRSEQNSEEQVSVILRLELPLWVRRVVSNVRSFYVCPKKKKLPKRLTPISGELLFLPEAKLIPPHLISSF